MSEFRPVSLPDLSGKVYLVTGGNAGIGYETVRFLALKNATVYIGCRSPAKGNTAIISIKAQVPTAKIHLLILDHMDLSSVVSAAKEFTNKEQKLHGLINNAGIMAVPFAKSKDGYESQWQTNYLAHFLLTHHLLPLLLSTARASQPGDVRIVNVSSMGHKFAPNAGIDFADINQEKGSIWTRYGQSKIGNILNAKELNRLYGPNGTRKAEGEIWSMALHPGNMYTDLNRNARFAGPLSGVVVKMLNAFGAYIPIEKGAYTSVFCAASEKLMPEMSGEYFVPLGKLGKASKIANNAELAEKLWVWSEKEFERKRML
ncbi:NAD(P)-binding protein [Stipitochalara longipes BDJ]|nr:NAD(P)-binding protein [Stipitochalara longipes BDJ]